MTAGRKIGRAGEAPRLASTTGNGNTTPVLAQLAALKLMSVVDLKLRWRELFGSEPPPYNRAFLESRLAYRVQELVHGGLRPATVARLEALANGLDAGGSRAGGKKGPNPQARRPIAGTRLIREWQGVEHTVTVLADGFDYAGMPYRTLSAVARAITGTRWNGWLFFGLKNHAGQG